MESIVLDIQNKKKKCDEQLKVKDVFSNKQEPANNKHRSLLMKANQSRFRRKITSLVREYERLNRSRPSDRSSVEMTKARLDDANDVLVDDQQRHLGGHQPRTKQQ